VDSKERTERNNEIDALFEGTVVGNFIKIRKNIKLDSINQQFTIN
jgi:hypothetical protein